MDLIKTLNEHVTLSGNGDSDIARVSALEACRLIRENKVVLSLPKTQNYNSAYPRQPVDDNGILMKSKYSSKCSLCDNYVEIGTDIFYKKGSGAAHKDCVEAGL